MCNSKTRRQIDGITCAGAVSAPSIESALRFCLHRPREMARVFSWLFVFLLQRHPARYSLIGAIFTVLSLRRIHAAVVRRQDHQHDDDNSSAKEQGERPRQCWTFVTRRRAATLRPHSTLPYLLTRKEDSPLLAPHLYRGHALPCLAGVCALRFSSTTDGVARNAISRPCHGR